VPYLEIQAKYIWETKRVSCSCVADSFSLIHRFIFWPCYCDWLQLYIRTYGSSGFSFSVSSRIPTKLRRLCVSFCYCVDVIYDSKNAKTTFRDKKSSRTTLVTSFKCCFWCRQSQETVSNKHCFSVHFLAGLMPSLNPNFITFFLSDMSSHWARVTRWVCENISQKIAQTIFFVQIKT
jgi:hypothetical protein